MRRWAFASLFLFTFAIPRAASTGTPQDKKGAPINIEYHGQSFYILTTSKDTRIAFDPHTIPQYGRTEVLPKVDVICISHNHNDHTRTVAFQDYQKTKVLRGLKTESLKARLGPWSTETVKDATIRTVGVYHDDTEGLQALARTPSSSSRWTAGRSLSGGPGPSVNAGPAQTHRQG